MFSEKPDLGQQTTKCPGQTEAPSQRHRSAETAATLSHHHTSQHPLVHQWSQWAPLRCQQYAYNKNSDLIDDKTLKKFVVERFIFDC